MNYEIDQLSDMDLFFHYGEPGSNLEMETQSDILAGLMQPKRSLFYNRQDSAGARENTPISFVFEIAMKYDIVNWISLRNSRVSDGSNGTPERRVAVSQNTISISDNGKGEMDVDVQYIPFANIKQTGQVTVPR